MLDRKISSRKILTTRQISAYFLTFRKVGRTLGLQSLRAQGAGFELNAWSKKNRNRVKKIRIFLMLTIFKTVFLEKASTSRRNE